MYSIEQRFCDGKPVEGEWVLVKDGHLLGVRFFDWPLAEAICAALNILTPEQREAANVVAYNKTIGRAA